MSKLIYFLLMTLVLTSDGYKILVIVPSAVKSHSILAHGVVKLLLEAGHEVTYITSYPDMKHDALKVIDVSTNRNGAKLDFFNIQLYLNKTSEKPQQTIESFIYIVLDLFEKTVEHKNVQELLYDESQKFDAVIAHWVLVEINAGYSAVFDCPLIWFYTQDPHWQLYALMDEVKNPAYSPDSWSVAEPPLTFIQRVMELWTRLKNIIMKNFYYLYLEVTLYEKLFAPIMAKKGKSLPAYEDIRYNASLAFCNSQVPLDRTNTFPQNLKAIRGFHIDSDVAPLPEDLQKIMDEAPNGVIYFSMGSILSSKDLPNEVTTGLLKMFSNLKYTVIWKFEGNLTNLPNNVHILKWAPQQSILSHKNCILFVSHGGLLSVTEAVHFNVPIICIPVFGDHFIVVKKAVDKGFAKKVDFILDTLVDDLRSSIVEVLSDSRYKENMNKMSFIYHHRLVPPGKELVHWVEHVIQTQGARHLRSPALMLPWYQKMYLDLILIIVIFVIIIKKYLSYLITTYYAGRVDNVKKNK